MTCAMRVVSDRSTILLLGVISDALAVDILREAGEWDG